MFALPPESGHCFSKKLGRQPRLRITHFPKINPRPAAKKRPLLQSMFLVWFSARANFERRASFGDGLAKSDFCHLFQLSKSLFAVETIRHILRKRP
jgi:hypothetical protein